MSQPLYVSPAAMQQAAQEFEQAVSEFTSTLTGVEGQIASLGAAWTGASAAQFRQAMTAWCSNFQNIIGRLQDILVALDGSKAMLVRGEDQALEHAAGLMRLAGF